MPRKTARCAAWRGASTRFNEAAARCRGKQLPHFPPAGIKPQASMRPRPDAAENGLPGAVRGRGELLASMRPRPDAAENPHRLF